MESTAILQLRPLGRCRIARLPLPLVRMADRSLTAWGLVSRTLTYVCGGEKAVRIREALMS